MTYSNWKAAVTAAGWTLSQLRCDERPSENLLAFMDAVGLDRYERFLLRFERELR